jgi:RNA polymerase sigma-70 factor, ECF subfamily
MDSSVNTVKNSEEEIDLIDCILAGQTSKFEILVANYQQRIYATLLGMLGNAQDAEDVTQETFLKAYRMLSHFERRSSFYTWLHRIAFNRAIDVQRRNKRTTKRCVGDEMLNSAPNSLDASDSPDAIAESNESIQLVQLAMSRLDQERRNIIVLRDIQGLDYAEIASMLELPIGTVRSRLHRARLELRDIMDSMGMGSSQLDTTVPGELPS